MLGQLIPPLINIQLYREEGIWNDHGGVVLHIY